MNAITKARKLAATLRMTRVDNYEDDQAFGKKVSEAMRGLNALWANPADVDDAARAKNELQDAWELARS